MAVLSAAAPRQIGAGDTPQVIRGDRPLPARLGTVVATLAATVLLAVTEAPAANRQASPVATEPTKVLVVVLENHAAADALRAMPYLAGLSRRYAVASAYRAITHPSLPNYLVIAGGSTFGVEDSDPPSSHRLGGPSVFGQVIGRGGTARTYAEGMTRNCQLTSDGRYAVRHNPWTYFASAGERAACVRHDVPSGTPARGALQRDIAAGRLPTFGLVVPDLCNDAHDCDLGVADAWLEPWLRQIEAGPDFRAGRLAVVVTFDEDDATAENHVLTVVLHPRLRGVVVTGRLDHHSLSAVGSRLVGATPLRKAAGSRDFLEAFGLR